MKTDIITQVEKFTHNGVEYEIRIEEDDQFISAMGYKNNTPLGNKIIMPRVIKQEMKITTEMEAIKILIEIAKNELYKK